MAAPVIKYKNGVPLEHDEISRHIVVIGDEGIGKTSLIKYCINDEDIQPFSLLICSMYPFTYVKPDGTEHRAAFVELAGGYVEDDRKDSYPYADVVLACFAIDDPLSLQHISTTWVPEIRSCQERAPPVMLIGLKKDLRTDSNVIQRLQNEGSSLVTEDQAWAVVEDLHLNTYMECSTRTGENAHLIFEEVLQRLN